MKAWIHSTLYNSSHRWWWYNVEYIFLENFGLLSTNWTQPTWVCCWACPCLYDHSVLLMAASRRMTLHVTQLRSFCTNFLNITVRSLPQMTSTVTRFQFNRVQWSNGRFTSRMCSRQLCDAVVSKTNIWVMFPVSCWICVMKNECCSEGKRGSSPEPSSYT